MFCMKKFYLTLAILFLFCCARSQQFSLNDLVGYTGYTPSRFENTIAKKGYRNSGFDAVSEGQTYTWFNKKHVEDAPEKTISKWDKEDKAIIGYQTTSEAEFTKLSQELKEEGYHYAAGAKTELYQKGNITITPLKKEEEEEGKTVYSFKIERVALPKAKDIQFAEDFTQL